MTELATSNPLDYNKVITVKGVQLDHSLVIPINEITILMAICSVGILALLGQVYIFVVQSFRGANK
jgi:hypothetical protein